MKTCVATVLSIALLLGNSVKLQAFVSGPVSSDGDSDSRASQVCSTCCQGPAASPGIPGLPGTAGPMGPYGQPGSKGDVGDRGQKGEIGPIGAMGDRGAPGNTGPKGDDGMGLPGKKGPRGPPGLDGVTGPTGAKGQKGEPGETPDDSNQRVAFTVVKTTHSADSSNRDYRLPFDATTTLLSGTNFNLGTGTFTCTVPGTYVFTFSVLEYGTSTTIYIYLKKNSGVVVTGHSGDTSSQEQVSGSAVLVLKVGDQVYLTMEGRSGSSANRFTSFSGFLLYSE